MQAQNVPIYLFCGPEFGERNQAVEKIKSDLKKKFGSCDFLTKYASDVSVGEVVSILSADSLFSSANCVIFKEAERIKTKADCDLLGEFYERCKKSAKNNSVLILISDEISVDSKLEKIIPKDQKKIFWEMFEDRKEIWLKNFFSKNGFSITGDATQTILELVENNTEALKSECSVFFSCFPLGHKISSEDVDEVLAHNREENAFTLFEAMANCEESEKKRFESSLLILEKILSTKNSSVTPALVAGLAFCFRKLSDYHSMIKLGKTSEADFRANGFSSKKMRAHYAKAARVWNLGQCTAICALLGETDLAVRMSFSAHEKTLLVLLLYESIMKKGGHCAQYEYEWEFL